MPGPAKHVRSPIVGDIRLAPPGAEPPGEALANREQQIPMLIELNALFPGGLATARERFFGLWDRYQHAAGGSWPEGAATGGLLPVPPGLAFVAPGLYQCVLSRATVQEMVNEDLRSARSSAQPPIIFKVWPDYTLHPQIDRSAPTVKADAAWRSYDARGRNIVWAVIDSGIDASHPHFSALELAKEASGVPMPEGLTTGLHRDFSFLVSPDNPQPPAPPGNISALGDLSGHGTHVAGIIAGCSPAGMKALVAASEDPGDGGYVPRAHAGEMSGMAGRALAFPRRPSGITPASVRTTSPCGHRPTASPGSHSRARTRRTSWRSGVGATGSWRPWQRRPYVRGVLVRSSCPGTGSRSTESNGRTLPGSVRSARTASPPARSSPTTTR